VFLIFFKYLMKDFQIIKLSKELACLKSISTIIISELNKAKNKKLVRF